MPKKISKNGLTINISKVKKLSKKERNKVYINALNYYYDNKSEIGDSGLCKLFKRVGVNIYWCTPALDKTEAKEHPLPEVLNFIYAIYPNLNWKERELILMFCIEMTK